MGENEAYLRQKLEWVKYRLKMLDEIESKLVQMRALAVSARDSSIDKDGIQQLNAKIHALEKEVKELDKQSRTFWLDNQ